MPRRRSRRPPPPPSDASPLPVPPPPAPLPAAASPSDASSRATSTPPPAAASTGRTPPLRSTPPPAAASTSRSPPLPCTPPPSAASTSRSPPLPSSPPPGAASTSRPPPPAAASRATSPPLPSTTSRPPPLLSPPPPAAACIIRPPPLHDPTPSPSLHHQLQPPQAPPVPPRRTYTPINLPEGRRFPVDKDKVSQHLADVVIEGRSYSRPQPPRYSRATSFLGRREELFTDIDGVSRRLTDVVAEGRSYSRPQAPPCEDTEQVVRIEAPPSPSPFPPVSALMPTGLLIKYFLRVDANGLFHTYPHRGGPFKSLQEAQDAIDSHHTNLCKFKYLGVLSKEDRYVWHTLYWHNGKRKNSKEALDAMMNLDPTREVVQALLDKHNEDHLLEDLAYEIEKIASYKAHFPRKGSQDECRSFSHLNVLVKRGPNAIKDLLFIEITCTTDGEFEEYALSCICAVSSDDDGECCECGDDVKHPIGVEYKKGEAKPRVRCRRPISDEEFNEFIVVRGEDWLEAEEARLRRQFRMSRIADGHGARGKYIVPAKRVQT